MSIVVDCNGHIGLRFPTPWHILVDSWKLASVFEESLTLDHIVGTNPISFVIIHWPCWVFFPVIVVLNAPDEDTDEGVYGEKTSA
jgi:hypothetical protein